ncbi:Na+/H+ antiporter NhaA [Leucothrix arctica]|uniref:Na(+)/H(+) antiporter NhaA n=1 Tax=Leucothrix arctica TaxID=1481894 RepID=A0A317C6B3_9GAMM|nr:Na+/H+ antiporter NhaA [Leucothrix arctica]PWQ93819.1 Na+/H+ antiporter NhaA [Leucothrix arctica]
MIPGERSNRLDRPVDQQIDHVLGPEDAEITLVEYGSYGCPNCRAVNNVIAGLRDQFGDRLRYVFRHRPLVDSDIARRAAELTERTTDNEQFWTMHVALMSRSNPLTENDLQVVASSLETPNESGIPDTNDADIRARVDSDINSAEASGVLVTPTFFIDDRRYEGPWDQHALSDAMLHMPGQRSRLATLDFLRWGPSAGLLLLLATILAVILTNSSLGSAFTELWQQPLGFTLGNLSFGMSIHHWINDGLLTFFFLVVGLEIKREFTVGHLTNHRTAALPIAAALGGMVVPALLYALLIPDGPWASGWGIPMATDTAFAIAVIAVLGSRVPVELRVFLTAAAVVDDIGAILVIAIFYSSDLQITYLISVAAATGVLALLNRAHVYRLSPYVFVGVLLWVFIYAAGVHATLAGVILAIFIPTRPPPNLKALVAQANAILAADMRYGGDVLRDGPSLPALNAIDTVHNRLESPAARLLRQVGTRSSYVVLPLFALANAGVVISMDVVGTHSSLMLAIVASLVIGKPIGMIAAVTLAVRTGIASKPGTYSWRQLIGATALAGIGFTMSIFFAGEAFESEMDLAAAKIAIFAASVIAACIGAALLWRDSTKTKDH